MSMANIRNICIHFVVFRRRFPTGIFDQEAEPSRQPVLHSHIIIKLIGIACPFHSLGIINLPLLYQLGQMII